MFYENEVRLQGYIGKQPEIRTLGNKGEMAVFEVVTKKFWKRDADTSKNEEAGQRIKEESENSTRVVCYNTELINKIKNYLKKGTKVKLDGELRTSKYVDNQGLSRQSIEVWTKALQFDNEWEE
jgi:single-strand DNA-binding protein